MDQHTSHPPGCSRRLDIATVAAVRRILRDHPAVDGRLCPLAGKALDSLGVSA
jgi:hypothetical protein